MATDIWNLPKDPSTGVVRGTYWLRHVVEGTTGTIGFMRFEDGRSTRPLGGRELVQFVSALGRDVDLEPADDEARAVMGLTAPEPVAAPVAVPVPVPAVEPVAEPQHPEPGVPVEPEAAPAANPEPEAPKPEPPPVDTRRAGKGRR